MKLALDVVLYQPEIPPNTGNIIRLCANTGASLHLIHPLGFELEDRKLRRAGLDYHEWANVHDHADFQTYMTTRRPPRLFAFTTKGGMPFQQVRYQSGDALLFGPETRGLPPEILNALPAAHWLRIPMQPESRSLNLSNAVAVAVYQVWGQLEFPGAEG
ncbi:MAG: tRNA (uridine(34)/cytosine(34)/5-carboxymethylaminomethyluridine(34)-2'-O)-methyltransferase TrmL [Gammaproteobacteria bacterium]